MNREDYPCVFKCVEYAENVVSKKQIAGRLIIAACNRFLNDLDRQDNDAEFPYIFDPDIAEDYCEKAQGYSHQKGRWAKTKIVLHESQCFYLCNLFGWVHEETGYRRFNEVYKQVGRKGGKSIEDAIIANIMAFEDGEYGSEVYCGATTENQAKEVFRPASQMMEDRKDEFGIVVLKSSITNPQDSSFIQIIIGKPGDGASPQCGITDEYHEHLTIEQYETLITGMGAREQPLMLVTTTAGHTIGGPCHKHYKEMREILLDPYKNDDNILILIYKADEERKSDPKKYPGDVWDSDEAAIKANPLVGITPSWDFINRMRNAARRSPSKQNYYKTKHLNLWVGSEVSWLNMLEWDACKKDITLGQFEGFTAYLGVDLSSFKDLCSIGIVIEDEDLWPNIPIFSINFAPEYAIKNNEVYKEFEQSGHLISVPGKKIDYDYVLDEIVNLGEILVIEGVAYDPWQAEYLATKLSNEGLLTYRFAQNYGNYNEPLKHFEALVSEQEIMHDGNPVLTWAMGNVNLKTGKHEEQMPVKESEDSPKKIDPAASILMAHAQIVKNNLIEVESLFPKDEEDSEDELDGEYPE